MQFLLLVFINILMACFFYLILRLKLEKYASDYREKRLKREMDEIINEFNVTAERNITILDNRIETIKTLLKKLGTIDFVDISINDSSGKKPINKEDSFHRNTILDNSKNHNKESIIEDNPHSELTFNKDNKNLKEKNNGLLSRLVSNIKGSFQRNYRSIIHPPEYDAKDDSNNEDYNDNNIKNKTEYFSNATGHAKEKIDIIIDYSQDEINLKPDNNETISTQSEEGTGIDINSYEPGSNSIFNDERLSENELEYMFSASKDKYLLISELYQKGYPADLISRSSGIPIGEIKLVVDLNKSL